MMKNIFLISVEVLKVGAGAGVARLSKVLCFNSCCLFVQYVYSQLFKKMFDREIQFHSLI